MLQTQAVIALSGAFLALFTEHSLLKSRQVVIASPLDHSQLHAVLRVGINLNVYEYFSEASHPQFSSYWKPICLLDAAVWQKWLHPHRLGLLLQHDFPLPRYLHQANPSGRFQQVQCRQAASVLFSTLKAWSSFVLIENHTYVKLIQKY